MTGRESTAVRGWVLYDGSCGFCSRWVPFWRATLARRGFGIATLQSSFASQRLALPEEERVSELRLLLADGTTRRGADVYRHLTRRIWWALPLFAFAVLPGTRQVFDRGYRTFAEHRQRISKACGLPAEERRD